MADDAHLVYIFEERPALDARAADLFVRRAAEAVERRGRFDVALSGGSTPRAVHRLLASEPRRDQVDWRRVYLWWGDDRHVPPDHPDSNYRMARETLIDHVPIPESNIHRIETELPAHEAAARYEARLREIFGGDRPALDLVFLGLGPDAHTLSLFPETEALRTQSLVAPNWVPKLNTWRVTLTAPAANAAREIIFLVAGPDKVEAVDVVLRGPHAPHQYPAQLIRPATWLLDAAAAARLP